VRGCGWGAARIASDRWLTPTAPIFEAIFEAMFEAIFEARFEAIVNVARISESDPKIAS
jgi:hypothetical protein